VKLDVLYSNFSDADVASLDQGRDYFRPASIPVAASAAAENSHGFLDFHAKDTRFSSRPTPTCRATSSNGTVELDFRTLPGAASEVVTNAYNPRVRRAVLQYDEWSFGQELDTFRFADAVPEHIDDLSGPVEALHIVRQPLLRYQLWRPAGRARERRDQRAAARRHRQRRDPGHRDVRAR